MHRDLLEIELRLRPWLASGSRSLYPVEALDPVALQAQSLLVAVSRTAPCSTCTILE